MRFNDEAMGKLHSTINHLYPNVYSLIILQNKEIIFEKYYRNAQREDVRDVMSVTKSIISALMGIAIQQGFIKDVEERVLDFFPGYLNIDSDPNILRLRIRNILTMTSGLYYVRLAGDSQPVAERRKGSEDWIEYMLDLPIKHPDLKTFCYSNFDADLCAAIIHTAVKMDLYDYAKQHLFSKTGMEVPRWAYCDPHGLIPGNICLTTRDMAKFGQLYLQNGYWDGEQVIDEQWVVRSRKNYGNNYGYLWWIDGDTYFASGAGGSLIWVIPKEGVVVASQCKGLKTNWRSPMKAVKETLGDGKA
ncbi:MAG: serine hydrolase [Lachnospiraceae bacterium]|nr:serine hydrolase [Lachnospiraceae bacterium]